MKKRKPGRPKGSVNKNKIARRPGRRANKGGDISTLEKLATHCVELSLRLNRANEEYYQLEKRVAKLGRLLELKQDIPNQKPVTYLQPAPVPIHPFHDTDRKTWNENDSQVNGDSTDISL